MNISIEIFKYGLETFYNLKYKSSKVDFHEIPKIIDTILYLENLILLLEEKPVIDNKTDITLRELLDQYYRNEYCHYVDRKSIENYLESKSILNYNHLIQSELLQEETGSKYFEWLDKLHKYFLWCDKLERLNNLTISNSIKHISFDEFNIKRVSKFLNKYFIKSFDSIFANFHIFFLLGLLTPKDLNTKKEDYKKDVINFNDFLKTISGIKSVEKKIILLNYEDEIHGTIDQLKSLSKEINSYELKKIINQLEDESNVEFSEIEIFNYLAVLTNNFDKQRVKITLKEIETFENLVLEEVYNDLAYTYYLENNREIPTLKKENRNGESIVIIDYNKMRNSLFSFQYLQFYKAKKYLEDQLTSENQQKLKISSELIGLTGRENNPNTLQPVTYQIKTILSKYSLSPTEAKEIILDMQGAYSPEWNKNVIPAIIKYLEAISKNSDIWKVHDPTDLFNEIKNNGFPASTSKLYNQIQLITDNFDTIKLQLIKEDLNFKIEEYKILKNIDPNNDIARESIEQTLERFKNLELFINDVIRTKGLHINNTINDKQTQLKYFTKHYVLCYILESHANGNALPIGNKRKLEEIGSKKIGKGKGNTFYKNFNQIVSQDLNSKKALSNIGGENWREVILEISENPKELEKYLQGKLL